MSVEYSFDIFDCYKVADKYHLLVSGWCFDTEKGIPKIYVEINHKKEEVLADIIGRSDVCNAYELNQDKFLRCGFRFKKEINGNLDFIRVIAEFKDNTIIINKLNTNNIIHHSIAYNIEEITKSKETGMYYVRGWVFSLLDKPILLSIEDDEGKQIEITHRQQPREDISAFCKDTSKCGFTCSFHYEENKKYNLIFESDEEKLKLPLDGLLNKNKITFKSILEKLNFKNIKKAFGYFKEKGIKGTIEWKQHSNDSEYIYKEWFSRHSVTQQQLQKQKEIVFDYSPKISILVPTYNTPIRLLKEMIESVKNQSYSKWELCIADGSTNKDTKDTIQKYVNNDSRIQVTWLQENYGISCNTNKALEIATGEYVALFDHDDLLEPDALFEVISSLQQTRHDIVYTDEDKLNDQTGFYSDPSFKPDWSPDLFLSHNYITHLFVVKTEIIKSIGGFHKEYDGAQDYDVMLRCIEKSNSIYHIPKVLYHWRIHEGSTAGDPESKMYAFEAGKKALEAHFDRCGINAGVSMLPKPLWGLYRVKYQLDEEPLVSIIIPNYEHADILKTCIDSLFNVNDYKNFEVIIVENNSQEKETFDYYEQIQKEHENVHVVKWEGKEFNYSAINNFGVKQAKGEYILLLNNDTEAINKDSLRDLVRHIQRDEVGIVGAKLLYEDDSIQHAGVVIGFSGYAGHVFNGISSKYEYGYMMRAAITCDYSAVTAACLMTKRELWDKVCGLDETFKVACNDVDYCLKIRDLDKLVVYDAFSLWHHYESKSRGYEDSPEKKQRFDDEVSRWQKKWNKYLPNNDPYYNKNWDISKGPYQLD